MIKLVEILEKIEEDLFDTNSTDPLIIKCCVREKSIKNNIIKAFNEINLHYELPNVNGELNLWQKNKVKRNIKNLTKYIEKLSVELNEEKIKHFCLNHNSFIPVWFEEDEFVLIFNSFYNSITLDLLWASDISVSDVYKISNGEIDYENLLNKLPDKIKNIESEILSFLRISPTYIEYSKSIEESIETFKNKNYRGSSLLVLVTIEGLVRRLGEYLIVKQNLDKLKLKKKYNSLDDFLSNIPWKKDYKIEKSVLMFLTGDYEFKSESNDDKIIYIDLQTRLEFLRRRFKVDRNRILHGDKGDFGVTWDLYLNFSALSEVYNTIKYYENLYN